MIKIYIPLKNTAWGVIKHPVKGNQYAHTIAFLDKNGVYQTSLRDEFLNKQFFNNGDWKTVVDASVNHAYDHINENKIKFSTSIAKQPHFSKEYDLANSDFCIIKNENGDYYFYVLLCLKRGKKEIIFEAELDIFFSYPNLLQHSNSKVFIERGNKDRFEWKNNQVEMKKNFLLTNDNYFFPFIETRKQVLFDIDILKDFRFIIIYMARRKFKKPGTSVVHKRQSAIGNILLPMTIFIIPYKFNTYFGTSSTEKSLITGMPWFVETYADSVIDIQIVNYNIFNLEALNLKLEIFNILGSQLLGMTKRDNSKALFNNELSYDHELSAIFVKDAQILKKITKKVNIANIINPYLPTVINKNAVRNIKFELKLLSENCFHLGIVSKTNEKRMYPFFTLDTTDKEVELNSIFNYEPKDAQFYMWLKQVNRDTLQNREIFVSRDLNSVGSLIDADDKYIRDNERQLLTQKNFLRAQEAIRSNSPVMWHRNFEGSKEMSYDELVDYAKSVQPAKVGIPGIITNTIADMDAPGQILKTRTSLKMIDAKISDMLQQPGISSSGLSAITNFLLSGFQEYYLQWEFLTDKHQQLVADFHAKNAYLVKESGDLKKFLNNRYRWNFIVAKDVFSTLALKLSAKQKQIIHEAFENGITFWMYRGWSDWKGIMSYGYENWEVSLLQAKGLI